jgi:hypothetical protein
VAGLTVADLAKAADTTTRTISRLEVGGPIYVAAKKRHGHVEVTLWNRIVEALAEHGVELLPEENRHGSGVCWINPRVARTASPS